MPAPAANAFLAVVVLVATVAAVPALLAFDVEGRDFTRFLVLAVAAAAAQMLVVETGKNYGFPTAVTFVVAGVLLLPVGLVVLLGVAMHAPDILRRRSPWYIQCFNTSNYTLNALGAWTAARAVSDLGSSTGTRWAFAGLVSCIVFVGLNHLLLAAMLRLARGHRARETGLFSTEALSIDLVLAGAGIAVAALAHENAALALAAGAPLLLAHRLFRLMAVESRVLETPR
jgi:hypothetical protein